MIARTAYCHRSGEIGIGRHVPEGAWPLAHGTPWKLRRAVRARARHALDGKTLIVAGMRDATTATGAYRAACEFSQLLVRGRPGLWAALDVPEPSASRGAVAVRASVTEAKAHEERQQRFIQACRDLSDFEASISIQEMASSSPSLRR